MKQKKYKSAASAAAAALGRMTSAAKKKSSKANGRLGGHWSLFKDRKKPATKPADKATT